MVGLRNICIKYSKMFKNIFLSIVPLLWVLSLIRTFSLKAKGIWVISDKLFRTWLLGAVSWWIISEICDSNSQPISARESDESSNFPSWRQLPLIQIKGLRETTSCEPKSFFYFNKTRRHEAVWLYCLISPRIAIFRVSNSSK